MKANPKELQEIYNLVCKTQWDLGRDESVKLRAKKIMEFWGEDTFINDVDESMIDGLVAELRDRNLSNASINRYLSAISTMITFCELSLKVSVVILGLSLILNNSLE